MENDYNQELIDGKYRILSLLGKGGFGSVYKAEHEELHRLVAVKILHRDSALRGEDRALLVREAKNLSKLQHQNIVAILSAGVLANDAPYLVMEFAEGQSLRSLLVEQQKLDLQSTLEISIQICDALIAAHKQHIVHRDLNPANIMVNKAEGTYKVKILDFGLSKQMKPGDYATQDLKLTATGALVGTAAYMAPEVCSGKGADEVSDIYALGCIMYECLAGQAAFQADNAIGLLYLHQNSLPARLETILPEIIPEFEIVIFKCLEKKSVDRFGSADELRDALELIKAGRQSELHLSKVKLSPSENSKPTRTSLVLIFPFIFLVALCVAIFSSNFSGKQTKLARSKFGGEPNQRAAFPNPNSISARKRQDKIANEDQLVAGIAEDFRNAALKKQQIDPTLLIDRVNKLISQSKNKRNLFILYQLKGRLYEYQGNSLEDNFSFAPDAIAACEMALKYSQTKDKVDSAESNYSYGTIVMVAARAGDYSKAEWAANKIIYLKNQASKNEVPSLELFFPNLTIIRSTNNPEFEAHLTLSDIEFKRKEYSKSMHDALQAAYAAENVNWSARPYLRMIDIYEAEGKKEKARLELVKLVNTVESMLVLEPPGPEIRGLFRNNEKRAVLVVIKSYREIADRLIAKRELSKAIIFLNKIIKVSTKNSLSNNLDVTYARQTLPVLKLELQQGKGK